LADTRIVIRGHADAAEAAAGKARVSRARAAAVSAFLRLNGVPAEVIKIDWFDAERLRVRVSGPEQRNRRVEIVPD
jgi:outer membrane protein OmpA-like peptidoglycan-associated protein